MSNRKIALTFIYGVLVLSLSVACSESKPTKEALTQALKTYTRSKCSWNIDGKFYRDEAALNLNGLTVEVTPSKNTEREVDYFILVRPNDRPFPGSRKTWVATGTWKIKRGGITRGWEIDEPSQTINLRAGLGS